MFRPATPLWAYVEQDDLTGKEVVLVTTVNSRFEQAETDAFAKRVEAHGGHLVRHVFLRRGRIFWQMRREELLKSIRAEMEAFRRGGERGRTRTPSLPSSPTGGKFTRVRKGSKPLETGNGE